MSLVLLYFILIRKSSRILYPSYKTKSWIYFIQNLILINFIVLFFVVIPEIIATVHITVKTPTFETCIKRIQPSAEKKTTWSKEALVALFSLLNSISTITIEIQVDLNAFILEIIYISYVELPNTGDSYAAQVEKFRWLRWP